MVKELKVKDGIYCGIPVFIGYFPIAVTFGLLSRSVNISLFESFCFSAFIFAGASQFVGLNMYHAGIGAGEITLTVFLTVAPRLTFFYLPDFDFRFSDLSESIL